MKRLFNLMLCIAIIVAFAAPAVAADKIFTQFMVGTAAGGKVTATARNYGAYVVIPGDNNAQVVVTSLSATSDGTATTHNLYVYDKENEATISAAAAIGASAIVLSSGGASFDANDTIVIQGPSGSPCFVETISSCGATTIALAGTLDYAVAAGYKVYEMEVIGHIPVGNGTVTRESNEAVIAGTKDSPVLLLVGGTSACAINYAAGTYK